LALVNLMQPVVDWFRDWWTQLAPGDRGTWFRGVATFLALALTLIISAATALTQLGPIT
jgi:hypothetical protein